MSINISSEDSASSCDLPDIGIPLSSNRDSQPRSKFTNQDDLTRRMKKKTNGCVDLTQDMICDHQDERVVLSGSPTRSLKANGRERSNSIHSDSTIELNPNEIDTDAIFDQIILNNSIRKSPNCVQLPLSTCVSGSSTASVPLRKSVSLKPCGSGISLQSASSSGYGSSGSRRRKSLDSIESSKSAKSLERANKRQKLAEERAAKQATSELNAIYKPGECMKHMIIEGHPTLLSSWYMANLQTEAVSSGVKVQQDPQLFHPGVIVFSRRRPQTLTGSDGQLTLSNPNEPCNQALLIQTADEIAPYVQNHTLASRVAEVNEILGRKLTLVVFGVKDYLNKPHKAEEKWPLYSRTSPHYYTYTADGPSGPAGPRGPRASACAFWNDFLNKLSELEHVPCDGAVTGPYSSVAGKSLPIVLLTTLATTLAL